VWYTILITLVVDFGGLLLVYVLLRDRVRRAASSESRIAEIRDEVSRLLVELNQATDRNIALMEDKISILNEALSTADKKIGLLRRETEKHDVGSQIYSRLAEGRHRRTAPQAAAAAALPPAAANPSLAAPNPSVAGQNPQAAGTSVGYADVLVAESAEAEPPVPPLSVELLEQGSRSAAPPDTRQRVMMLYRAGFSPSLIASRVGAPLGEVELMIALEQRKGQA
jgi:hypothetical protein